MKLEFEVRRKEGHKFPIKWAQGTKLEEGETLIVTVGELEFVIKAKRRVKSP